MGAILESTAIMDGWSIEARRESFYLHDPEPEYTGDAAQQRNPALRFEVRTDGFALDVAEVPHVLAALDQVEEWRQEHGQATEPGPVRMVSVRRNGDQVVITGDVGAASLRFLHEEGYDRAGALEITYAEVPILREGLITAV